MFKEESKYWTPLANKKKQMILTYLDTPYLLTNTSLSKENQQNVKYKYDSKPRNNRMPKIWSGENDQQNTTIPKRSTTVQWINYSQTHELPDANQAF